MAPCLRMSLALFVLLAASLTPSATAQTGAVTRLLGGGEPEPQSASVEAKSAAAGASRETFAAIDKAQAAAQAELDAIDASPGAALGAPPGTSASEIAARLAMARQLPTIYQQQRDLLDRTETARKQKIEAERALESWSGFPTPPPYSVLFIDELRDNLASAEARIARAESRQAMFERFSVEIGSQAKASQAAARLAAEAAERSRGTPTAPKLDWQRELAALRARVDEATQDVLQIGLRNAREEIAAANAVRTLARRQLAAAGPDIVFPAEDLERVNADLDKRRRDVDRLLERALHTSAAAQDARSAAEKALADARAAPAGPGDDPTARTARIAALATDADEKREFAVTGTLRVELLKGFQVALAGERLAWKARAEAIATRDPLQVRAAYERLAGSLATIRAWRQYMDAQLLATHDRIVEQETRVRVAESAEAASAQRLLDTYRERESGLRLALERSQPLERLLERFRGDFEGRREFSLAERARDVAAGAWLRVRRIWNIEMFTVDDTFEAADGRKLEVARSVTIGKTAGAALIVVVGYWFGRLIARWIERIAVRRGRVAPQAAALLRNWVLFVLGAILVIFALLSAGIPLTVFAFFGGALAIAAGFGLQTLLKNFVAGVMLLVERPMRLGDLVEVDGVRGRVTDIGIRASTITTADGIESLIPNSTFIESKLTNWTFSNPRTRQTITIGVAYGTPLRRAADALAGVLGRHGLVLKDPAPEVYLDNYGDSAITFALTYWVEMTSTGDSRRVKSDLLSMIDSAFAEAGIRMPFPQRDIRVDGTTPLRVEVISPRPESGAAG